MSFRLKRDESIQESMSRVMIQQLESCANLLGATDQPEKERIHQARRHLQRIRAILRLLRNELGAEVFTAENTRFRDLGRLLSGARDADVLSETLGAMRPSLARHFTDAELVRLDVEVRRHAASLLAQCELGSLMSSSVAELESAKQRVRAWSLEHDEWGLIEKGLRRSYRIAKDRCATSSQDPSAFNLHEWRKSVKYLRFHCQLLRPIWKPAMDELITHLHSLADELGELHDLEVLRLALVEQGLLEKAKLASRSVIINAIRGRQRQLRCNCEELGKRIFAESPKAFSRRLENYFDLWRDQPRAEKRSAAATSAREMPGSL